MFQKMKIKKEGEKASFEGVYYVCGELQKKRTDIDTVGDELKHVI